MLRQAFTDRLEQALKARDLRTVSTARLILAGLKDRDIAARGEGRPEGISDDEIRQMLQTMIKQRRDSIALYEQGNRSDLAQQEGEEIAVIESFLPPPAGSERDRSGGGGDRRDPRGRHQGHEPNHGDAARALLRVD